MSAPYGGHYSPHVHYRADVRPEDKHTARSHNFAYSDTAYAAQDPSSHTHHTPTRARQALPRRSSLRSSANCRAPAPAQPQQPAPLRNVYLENWRRARALYPDLFPPEQSPAGTFAPNVESVPLAPSTPQATSPPQAATPLSASLDPPFQNSATACPDSCRPRLSTTDPNTQKSYCPPSASRAAPQISAGHTPAAAQPPDCAVTPAAHVSNCKDGHVTVRGPVSVKNPDGICAFSVVSSWEEVRSLDISEPVPVNDLRAILQQARNLEHAYFASIVPSSTDGDQPSGAIDVPKLKTLVCSGIQGAIGGVLDGIRSAKGLRRLEAIYAPDSKRQLWADEYSYCCFVYRCQGAGGRRMAITSNDEWYQHFRAETLKKCLENAAKFLWTVEVQ